MLGLSHNYLKSESAKQVLLTHGYLCMFRIYFDCLIFLKNCILSFYYCMAGGNLSQIA